MLFLGIDGGGTKTAFCLVDTGGRVVARVEAPSTYYFGNPAGIAAVERVLVDGVQAVCQAAGVTPADVDRAFVALPGYGESSTQIAALDALPRAALGHDRYSCGNDMVAGWAGSLAGADGINIVAGTGSICYGERAGVTARVGGWSELFGDEGSAYWIAVQGLRVFSRMSDGRQEPGPLRDALRAALGIRTDLDAIGVVNGEWEGNRARVAGLSRVVADVAATGDRTAQAILADAARELAEQVETAANHLGFAADEPVAVSYSGGVFRSEWLRNAFVERLDAAARRYGVREPLLPPDHGAALDAARLAGRPIAMSVPHESAVAHNPGIAGPG
jgi:N-acetylglucosamine kinase-like BadF-type ATPase